MIAAPTDRRIAELCRLAYDPARVPTWTVDGKVRAFLFDEPECPTVIFEGTRPAKLADWLRDIEAAASTIDPKLGPVHSGFLGDVLAVIFPIFRELKGKPVAFGGHSKGGSEAEIAAAIWSEAGETVARVTAFEPARVGLLGGIVAGLPGISTHIAPAIGLGDPVPDVPSWLPHPRPLTIWRPVQTSIDPVEYHELDTVIAAMPQTLAA